MAYRPTARTRARQMQQRQRILDAARQRVAADGFAGVAMAAVAEAAGVATGTVYRYFPSKADLFAEVFRVASGREVAVMAEIVDGPGSATARARRAIETWARRAIAGRAMAYALIAEPVLPEIEAERLAYRRAYAEVLTALVLDGVQRGEFTVRDAALTAAALVGAMAEALVGPLAPSDHTLQDRSDAIVEALLEVCLNALGAPAPPENPCLHERSPN